MTTIPPFLHGIVDYAGLFPPAKLPLRAAVENYARYRSGEASVMLGAFVLPATAVAEFLEHSADLRSVAHPWPLSLLVGSQPEVARPYLELSADDGAIVVSLEASADDPLALGSLRASISESMATFVEFDWSADPLPWVEALGELGLRAKIRTGGVEASMIPPVEALAGFSIACLDAGLPFKATAGLHHPIRGEHRLTYDPDPPRAVMHGFLNLFVGSALYRAGVIDGEEFRRVLRETNGDAFEVFGDRLGWRGRQVPRESVARRRADFACSFGSCSFEEPLADLSRLEAS